MLVNELLTNNYRYKWIMLRYIDNNRNNYCTMHQISKILDISPYKAGKYLEEINEDIKITKCKAVIEVIPDGEIRTTGIDYLLLKQVRIMYLKKCEIFNMFHNFFVLELPIKQQIKSLHISQSSLYLHYRELKSIINEDGLLLEKNMFIGNELHLRSIFFSTYYELFNGVENPFPENINKSSQAILKRFSEYFLLSVPKTKELKLLLFIDIWLIRLNNQHFIAERYVEYIETDFTKWLYNFLLSNYGLSKKVLSDEISYLLQFFHFEIENIRLINHFVSSRIDIQANEITEEFAALFARRFNYDLRGRKEHLDLLTEITNINRKWLIYHFRDQTFVIKGKFNYFEEINPKLDQFIKEFIHLIEKRKLFLSNSERNKLYYDYLFLLVTNLPLEKIEDPLYICIDFSHGKNYNKYIRTMLSSLQSMNIRYETRISVSTHLFLSDCAMDKLICKQLIWKKPPTADDWRELGEELVKIKEKDCER